jgi:putative CocE/NonD family hydrolase
MRIEGAQAIAPELTGVRIERDVEMRTRDGVVLRSDVYRPAREGRWPVLLMRTPYDKSYAHEGTYMHAAWFARQGFVVVAQDVRGMFASDGEFVPFANEGEDGYDAVEWAAGLDGSNGRVGMYGASYVGAVQLLAAAEAPPHLKAIAPAVTSPDFYSHWTYEGGALHLAFVATWAVQLAENVALRAGD